MWRYRFDSKRISAVLALASMIPTALGLGPSVRQVAAAERDETPLESRPGASQENARGLAQGIANPSFDELTASKPDQPSTGQPVMKCGPCALYTLLESQGIHSSVPELSELSNTTESGTTMLGLKQAASAKGLELEGVVADSLSEVSLPFIAFVNEDHFRLVRSSENGFLSVQDNLGTPYLLPIEEFYKEWSGEALVLSSSLNPSSSILPDDMLTMIRGGINNMAPVGLGRDKCDFYYPSRNHLGLGDIYMGYDQGGLGGCNCDSGYALQTLFGYNAAGQQASGGICIQSPDDWYWKDNNKDGDPDGCLDAHCGDEIKAGTDVLALPGQSGPGQPSASLNEPPDFAQTGMVLPEARSMFNLGLGGMNIVHPDIVAPSVGDLSLDFTRQSYNFEGLHSDSRAGLGQSWTTKYNRSLHAYKDSIYSPTESSLLGLTGTAGVPVMYTKKTSTHFEAWGVDDGSSIDIVSGEYVFSYRDGFKYGFGSVGVEQTNKLQWIEDNAGNRLTLSYDGSNRLTRVSSPSADGRYLDVEYDSSLSLVTKVSLNRADDSTITYTEYTYEAVVDEVPQYDDISDPDETVYSSSLMEYADITQAMPAPTDTGFSYPTNGLIYHLKTVRRDGAVDGSSQPAVTTYTYSKHALHLGAGTTAGWFDVKGERAKGLGVADYWIKNTNYQFIDLTTGQLETAEPRQIVNVYHLASIEDVSGNVYTVDYDYPVERDNPSASTRGVWKGDVTVTIVNPDGLKTVAAFDKSAGSTLVQNIDSSTSQLLSQISYEEEARYHVTGARLFPNSKVARYWELGQSSGTPTQWTYVSNSSGVQTATPPGGSDPYMTVTYNSDRITSVRSGPSSGGVTWSWFYDFTHASPTKVQDPTGVATTFTIGSNERVEGFKPAWASLSSGYVFAYNGQNQVTKVTDPNGVEWNYGRDSRGNVTSIQYLENGSSRTRTFDYNDLDQITEFVDEAGSTTTYYYADLTEAQANGVAVGTLLYVDNDAGYRTYFDYDLNGLVTTVTPYQDNATPPTVPGPVTFYTYDSMNRVSTVTIPHGSPDARTTSFEYNLLGKLTKVTDPEGNETTYAYDHMGQVTSVDDALASGNITYAYNPIGTVSKVTVNKGGTNQEWTYTYDAFNRLSTVTDPASRIRDYDYDLAGRVLKVGAGSNGTVDPLTFTYETTGATKRGLLKSYSYPNESSSGGRFTATYDYDTKGRMTQIHDNVEAALEAAYGGSFPGIEYTFDTLNRTTQIKTYGTTEATFGYNVPSRQNSFTDVEGYTRTFTYDALYRLSTLTAPGSKTWTYEYNTLNQPTKYTHPNGMTSEYLFDADDYLLDQITHDDGSSSVLQSYNFRYDDDNNITKVIEDDGTEWVYTYDSRLRLSTATRTESSNVVGTYEYEYDAADNLTSLTLPFQDDFNDRVVTDDGWSASGTWGWDDTNGASEARPDTSGGDATLYRSNTDASLDLQFTYTNYDTAATNNRLQVYYRYEDANSREWLDIYDDQMVLRNYDGSAIVTNSSVASVEDQPYRIRLVASGASVRVYRDNELVLQTSSSQNGATDEIRFTVTQDADIGIDDIVIVSDDLSVTRTFSYNLDNSLASYTDYDGTTSFTYDAWGRPSAQSRTADSVAQNIEFYYGIDNRLIRTDGRDWPDFGHQVTDTYRGDGKRYARNQHTDASGANGTITSYYYAGGFDAVSEQVGTDIKTRFGGLGEAIGDSSSIGDYRYFTHDHLGSVREVRDESIDLEAEFAYGPYGDAYFAQEAAFALAASDAVHVTRRFTGHSLDLASGLYGTPFRTYSPSAGRWLQPDPLGMVDGPNMYAYVGGNPTNVTDPLGLWGIAFGNDSGTKKYFQIGWGDPWLHFSLRNQFEATAQGLMAFADGVIWGSNPFEDAGGYNACEYGLSWSRNIGFATSIIESILSLGLGAGGGAVEAAAGRTTLYRAVSPAELSDLVATGGVFRNPIGIEAKYFSLTAKGAASYAKQTLGTGLYQGPYTIVQTNISSALISSGIRATVDRGIAAVALPTNLLSNLSKAAFLGFSPIP